MNYNLLSVFLCVMHKCFANNFQGLLITVDNKSLRKIDYKYIYEGEVGREITVKCKNNYGYGKIHGKLYECPESSRPYCRLMFTSDYDEKKIQHTFVLKEEYYKGECYFSDLYYPEIVRIISIKAPQLIINNVTPTYKTSDVFIWEGKPQDVLDITCNNKESEGHVVWKNCTSGCNEIADIKKITHKITLDHTFNSTILTCAYRSPYGAEFNTSVKFIVSPDVQQIEATPTRVMYDAIPKVLETDGKPGMSMNGCGKYKESSTYTSSLLWYEDNCQGTYCYKEEQIMEKNERKRLYIVDFSKKIFWASCLTSDNKQLVVLRNVAGSDQRSFIEISGNEVGDWDCIFLTDQKIHREYKANECHHTDAYFYTRIDVHLNIRLKPETSNPSTPQETTTPTEKEKDVTAKLETDRFGSGSDSNESENKDGDGSGSNVNGGTSGQCKCLDECARTNNTPGIFHYESDDWKKICHGYNLNINVNKTTLAQNDKYKLNHIRCIKNKKDEFELLVVNDIKQYDLSANKSYEGDWECIFLVDESKEKPGLDRTGWCLYEDKYYTRLDCKFSIKVTSWPTVSTFAPSQPDPNIPKTTAVTPTSEPPPSTQGNVDTDREGRKHWVWQGTTKKPPCSCDSNCSYSKTYSSDLLDISFNLATQFKYQCGKEITIDPATHVRLFVNYAVKSFQISCLVNKFNYNLKDLENPTQTKYIDLKNYFEGKWYCKFVLFRDINNNNNPAGLCYKNNGWYERKDCHINIKLSKKTPMTPMKIPTTTDKSSSNTSPIINRPQKSEALTYGLIVVGVAIIAILIFGIWKAFRKHRTDGKKISNEATYENLTNESQGSIPPFPPRANLEETYLCPDDIQSSPYAVCKPNSQSFASKLEDLYAKPVKKKIDPNMLYSQVLPKSERDKRGTNMLYSNITPKSEGEKTVGELNYAEIVTSNSPRERFLDTNSPTYATVGNENYANISKDVKNKKLDSDTYTNVFTNEPYCNSKGKSEDYVEPTYCQLGKTKL